MEFVKIKVKSFFSLFFRAGRYVAVLEYAHLSIKLDLKKAIGEVKEACENIQRTTEHVRRKVEGMVIHAMMYLVRVAPDCNRSYCEDSFSGYSGSV